MNKMTDDKAQMMVLESILFAITVVVALIFLVQLSPTSIQSSSGSTTNLKILGDDALNTVYTETSYIKNVEAGNTTNNPTSKLAVSIITNNYSLLVNDTLNRILPVNVLYNIYISNGTNTTFWCSSTGTPGDGALPSVGPVSISHHMIAIDPEHLTGYHEEKYNNADRSDICSYFIDVSNPYYGSTYDVILEMWRI